MKTIAERIDRAIAVVLEAGENPSAIQLNDGDFAAFMVQGEADTLDPIPKEFRRLPIIRVRDGTSSAVRYRVEDVAGRGSVPI